MKFRYIFFILTLSVVSGSSLFGQSFAQVTWNTFEEKEGLFSIQIPSNWIASEVSEAEALAPIDYIFRYNDKGNSFAWVEVMISKDSESDARSVAESYVSYYQEFDDFALLDPIDCNTYTLNDAPACSLLSSQQLEGEQERNVLNMVSVTPDGVQTDAIFITSNNIYDSFFPVGEYIIKSLDINSTMVNLVLDNQSTENIQSEIPVLLKEDDTSQLQSDTPPIPTQDDTLIQQETFRSVFDTYENPNLGFSLEYPADWAKEETLSFISPPPSPNETLSASNVAPESIAVTTEVLFSNITLDEYSESAIDLLENQFPNFTLIDSFETTLSGYPAHQIEYTYILEGSNLKNMQIWTIAGNNVVYALTYGGIIEEFDSSLPVIENMIESFQLTEIQQ